MRRLAVAALMIGALLVGFFGARFAGPHMAAPTPADELELANGAVRLAEGITAPDALTLHAATDLFHGHPARNADGTANMIVEIPAGTNSKWEVDKAGVLKLEIRDGAPRAVRFLPYPGNYGMIPGTLLPRDRGGDGDALDVIVLGPALPRGSIARVRIIGVMKYLDGGDQDDKLLAVMDRTPLGGVRSLAELNHRFPGASSIVKAWFDSYKGPGTMEFQGWGEAPDAAALLDRAIEAYGTRY